jgi:glycosyltransferase involved in cell wall biosynthesis
MQRPSCPPVGDRGQVIIMANKNMQRIAYLAGPVDAVDVHQKWLSGQLPEYFGDSHVAQFFDMCAREHFCGYVITTLPSKGSAYVCDNITIENCPPPKGYRGPLYHIARYFWLAKRIPQIRKFQPDVFLLTADFRYGIVLAVLKLFKIRLITVVTSTIWPSHEPLKLTVKMVLASFRFFFNRFVDAAVFASEAAAAQARSLIPVDKFPVSVFLPVYPRKQFASIRPAAFGLSPARILFAGRIEKDKGVFDMVEAASRLEREEPGKIKFDVCGEGSQLDALRQRIEAMSLSDVISCHGFCGRDRMSEFLSSSSIVIVPTRTDFAEGFNMVCAEAILAGRPLVTSDVCPALFYVREATVEVRPNNTEDYANAILRLVRDKGIYEQKLAACKQLQEQFYDPANSWAGKVREAIAAVG